MPEEDGRALAIVSDLHLSAGYDPLTGTFGRNEDFFSDDAFGRFLDHLLARGRREGRRWRLVLLGDVVDFLQVELADEDAAGGATASGTSVRRLDLVAAGHPGFFAALARFLAGGGVIDVVVGNHDVEFVWPAVQARFRQLVAAQTAADVAAGIAFHPWVFSVPGVVYAEHGHQYDPINAFLTPLAPFLPDDPSLIALPLGSFFVRYLFNRVERLDPFADNVKPATRYLGWALRNHPILTLSTLDDHLRLLVGALRKTVSLPPAERARRRAAYHEAVVRPAAAAIGLPPATLVAIDELAAIPSMTSPWEQLKALLLEPVLPAVGVLAGFGAASAASRRLPPPARGLLLLGAGLGVQAWRERGLLRPATGPNHALLAAARAIHERLAATGRAVPAYVFGHTHTAERFPLGDGGADGAPPPSYVNAGTWTPIVPATLSLLATRELPTFVEIARDPWRGVVRPRLLVWNDAAGRAETLSLLRAGDPR